MRPVDPDRQLRFHHRLPAVTALAIAMWSWPVASAADATEGEEIFVHRVLPVLKTKCVACHGADDDKVESDFILLTRAGMLRGDEMQSIEDHP